MKNPIMTNQVRLERTIITTPKETKLFVIEIIAEGLLVTRCDTTPYQQSVEFGMIGIDRQTFIYSGEFKTEW
jgi:hypothetical protein